MRYLRRIPSPGVGPRTEDTHVGSAMAGDGPPAAVQPLLRAIAGDPRPHELSGFQEPLAAYRAAFPVSRPFVGRTWRTRMLSPLGASIAGLALALGGTAAAAYTGALPTAAQNFAHTVIGAPAAHPVATTSPSATDAVSSEAPSPTVTSPTVTTAPSTGAKPPVGPDAGGSAMFGLCTAWTAHHANGETTNGTADDAVAFKNLAAAAGGADKIAAYCATILQTPSPAVGPGQPTEHQASQATSHPTGKPSSPPTQANTNHPGGKPSPVRTKA